MDCQVKPDNDRRDPRVKPEDDRGDVKPEDDKRRKGSEMAAYRGNDYYRGLAVVDRCCEEAAKKGWSSYALGKKTFRNATQWVNIVGSARTPKIGTLNKIAAALDVSVAYLLSGCSCDYGRYKPCRVNLRRLLELPRRHGLDAAQHVLFSNIRHNLQKDICLPVVFELESVFGLPAHKLVFEYEQEGIYTKGF